MSRIRCFVASLFAMGMVWMAHAVFPSGYTQLEYLESSGTQYVNTGIVGEYGLEFDLDLVSLDSSSDTVPLGSRIGSGGKRIYGLSTKSGLMHYGFGDVVSTGLACVSGVRYRGVRTVLHSGEQSISYGDLADTGTVTDAFSTQNPIYIFGCNKGADGMGWGGKIRFYAIKISRLGNLMGEYVPCRRNADGALGFYDVVGNQFLANDGTGALGHGLACAIDGTTLALDTEGSTGALTVAGFTGYANLIKNGAGTLTVSPALANNGIVAFGELTLNAGELVFPAMGNPLTVTASSLVLNAGTLGYAAAGSGGVTALNVSGTAAVNGAITVSLPNNLMPGTYHLLAAEALAFADGASCTLAPGAERGAGTTQRQLIVNATGIDLAVTGEMSLLPAGYTQLDYLISNGNQSIDTNLIATDKTRAEVDTRFIDFAPQDRIFGVYGLNYSSAALNFVVYVNGNKVFASATKNATVGDWTASGLAADKERHTYVLDAKNCLFEIDGVRRTCNTVNVTGTSGEGRTILLFGGRKVNGATHTPYGCSRQQFYSARFYEDDVLVRDFVPCINPEGEAGLYDTVDGKFYGNAGRDRFYSAFDRAARVTSLTSYNDVSLGINTEYIHQPNDVFEFTFNPAKKQPSYAVAFGARKGGGNADSYCCNFWVGNTSGNVNNYYRGGGQLKDSTLPHDQKLQMVCSETNLSWTATDGSSAKSLTVPTHTPGTGFGPIAVFCQNTTTAAGSFKRENWCFMTLYSFKISSGSGVAKRDMVPYRTEVGTPGLYDAVTSKLYTNSGANAVENSVLACGGIAYSLENATMTIDSGTLESADELAGATTIVKATPYRLDASVATAFPSLTISAGVFSVANGTVAPITCAGTLTLAGGTRWCIDVGAAGCDTIAVTAADLSGASVSAPITVALNPVGVTAIPEGERFPVITGANLAAGDAAKFVAVGLPVQFVVVNGELMMEAASVGTVVWSGAAENDPQWSNAGNWENGRVPETGSWVQFNLASGGTTSFNIENLALGGMTFKQDAGAFTHNGGTVLTVQAAITNESSLAQTFNMPVALGVEGMPFEVYNTGSLELVGGVENRADSLVKKGRGTLVADGTVMAASNIVLAAGTLKLSDASTVALTTEQATGHVTIEAGAQLDVNYPLKDSNNAIRNSYTSGKTFFVAGDGPDHQGAVVNTSSQATYLSALTQVTLTGDAAFGGSGRIDIRNGWSGGPYTGRPYLSGPDNTATSKIPVKYGLFFSNADINLAKLIAAPSGHIGADGTMQINIPNGIELQNNAELDLYGATVSGTGKVTVCAGAMAKVNNFTGTAKVNVPVEVPGTAMLELPAGTVQFGSNTTVAAGGELKQSGSSAFTLEGPMAVNGTFTKSSTGALILDAPITGSGEVNVTAGDVRCCGFFDYAAEHGPTYNMSGSGYLRFGNYTLGDGKAPMHPPAFETFANEIRFSIASDTVIDDHAYDALVAQAGAAQKWVRVYAQTPKTTLVVKNSEWNLYALGMGDGADFGAVRIDEGAVVNIDYAIRVADQSSPPRSARLEIVNGGELNFNGGDDQCRLGHWSGATYNHRHDILVDGGTFNATNGYMTVGHDAPWVTFTQKSGKVAAKGLRFRSGNGHTYDRNAHYIQNGGDLELGAAGLTCYSDHSKFNGRQQVSFNGGSLKATAPFANTYGRIHAVFGSEPTGDSRFDLGGNAIDWRNQLAGVGALTIAGEGSWSSPAELQNMVMGKWTVEDGCPAQLDFSGAAGFSGGLELGTNTSARIAIGTSNLVEFAIFKVKEFANVTAVLNHTNAYQMTVNNMDKLHQTPGSALVNNCYFCYRGQFYVSPEQADKTWYFAGTFDDYVRLLVDGVQVLDSGSYTKVGTGSATLAEGWHDFRVIAYDGTGGQGPGVSGWKNVMGLGFSTNPAANGSMSATLYTKFSPANLPMRVKPIDGTTQNGYASMLMEVDGPGSTTAYRDGSLMYTNYNAVVYSPSWLDSYKVATIDGRQMWGRCFRFTGLFKVDSADAGSWKFTGQYDDRIALKIDGTERFATTAYNASKNATLTLAAGWHTFEIDATDTSAAATSGGYGAMLTDSTGAKCSIHASVNGAPTKAFNMRNFKLAATPLLAAKYERAGLDGTIRLAQGASLVNTAATACPIFGTLEGAGALSGAYAFTQEGTWRVAANASRLTAAVNTTEVSDSSFVKNLRHVELELEGRSAVGCYRLCAAGSLTAEEAAEIEVVTTENGVPIEGWTARVKNMKLELVNPHTPGSVLLFR